MNRKGSVLVLIPFIAVVVLIVGGIWYWKTHQSKPSADQHLVVTAVQAQAQTSPVVPVKFQNKIAFLKNGEVWVANEDGSDALQITQASGTITGIFDLTGNSFSFSPSFQYLEYNSAGTMAYNEDGTVVNVPQDIIHILDLNSGNVVETIDGSVFASDTQPYEYPWVDFTAWVGGSQFVVEGGESDFGHGGGAYTIGALVFDLQKATSSLIEPQGTYGQTSIGFYFGIVNSSTEGYAQNYSFQIHYPYVFYTESDASASLVQLHAYDILSTQDNGVGTIYVSSTISGYITNWIQPDYNMDKFLYFKGSAVSFPEGGTLSLYSLGTISNIYFVSSDTKLLSDSTWSADDNFLAFQTENNNFSATGTIFIADVSNPTEPKIVDAVPGADSGSGLQWTGDGSGIISLDGNLYRYNLQTGSSTLFSTSSSDPFVF